MKKNNKSIPKIIAWYLPQFHQIPENDEWWGKGFTEWTAARKATKLFDGHWQPRLPMNDNYYNLLDKKTMQWQATLAKKYGIDGFAIYHYWFKDGRKILEKPAENLLNWKDVDLPFCFDWANESWARRWNKFVNNANVWNFGATYKKKAEQLPVGSDILLKQTYGNEKDWHKHFNYLLPFFKDARYIKYNGQPVFIIYRPNDIPCLSEMAYCWNKWAKEAGFSGIYFIGRIRNFFEPLRLGLNAQVLHIPILTYAKRTGIEPARYDYKSCWRCATWSRYSDKSKIYLSGILPYDDTPRRGSKGTILTGASPEIFCSMLIKLIKKSINLHNDFVFLNAWNEWGEGMYLEPDNKYGYKWLAAVNEAKNEVITGRTIVNSRISVQDFDSISSQLEADTLLKSIYDEWLDIKIKNISLSDFFIKKGYKKIYIYGYGKLGKYLVQDLGESDINILGIIDKAVKKINSRIPLFNNINGLPKSDAIIVTPAKWGPSIKRTLLQVREEPVILLQDLFSDIKLNILDTLS